MKSGERGTSPPFPDSWHIASTDFRSTRRSTRSTVFHDFGGLRHSPGRGRVFDGNGFDRGGAPQVIVQPHLQVSETQGSFRRPFCPDRVSRSGEARRESGPWLRFQVWRGTSPNYTPKRGVDLPALPNSPDSDCKSRVGWFATSPFPCGLHRPTSEILQKRFRVLSHQAGKSEGWSSGNSWQSLYSGCTADLEIVAFSAMLAFSGSVS
jgi:hypothetical protein